MKLDPKIPTGPIAEKWDRHKFEMKLVNPANKRKYTIICVGTGLAGASAAASLGELGYNVLNFCIQDSPRRAHSIAAQGGINAAKNYQNDGDSIYRLFYDTVKGGDYRSREANVYRLAQLSVDIIDQCVAQGVPFAREYGGLLDNRSFGGAQVSRTFYARGQTGQQLLLGAYQSLMRQVHEGTVRLFARREMLDLVVIDGRARGIIARNLVTGEIERHAADAVDPRHRRLRNRLLPVDQRRRLERDRIVAGAQARRALRESVLHADPPDLHPGHRRPPVEAHADERKPAQRRPGVGAEEEGRYAAPGTDPRGRTRLLPRTQVSELRQPGPARRGIPQRQAGLRRGTRRRRKRPRRLPRLRRCHQTARPRDHPGKVRQPLPHVQEDHRRGCVQGADAHLSGHPLHDGRAVGRLQPDEQPSRAARARRGQLLRPRCEPAGRQRADAGAGRRLLHHPLHHRPLPRELDAPEGDDRPRRLQRSGRQRAAADQSAAGGQGIARHPRNPS